MKDRLTPEQEQEIRDWVSGNRDTLPPRAIPCLLSEIERLRAEAQERERREALALEVAEYERGQRALCREDRDRYRRELTEARGELVTLRAEIDRLRALVGAGKEDLAQAKLASAEALGRLRREASGETP